MLRYHSMDTSAKFLLLWVLFLLEKTAYCRTDCGPRRLDLVVDGRVCQPPCAVDGHCVGLRRCICDYYCGMSCVDLSRRCTTNLPKLKNGVVLMTGSAQVYGSRVHYGCSKGYQLSRMDERICRSDGKWSGVTPMCLPILCPSPPTVESGYAIPMWRDEWPFGSEVTYHCNTGYEQSPASQGSVVMRCDDSGRWSGVVPRCVEMSAPKRGRCSPPPGLTNGWYQRDDNDASFSYHPLISGNAVWAADDVIIYNCKPGYDLVRGDLRRVCKWNGDWTGRQPRCVPTDDKPTEVFCDSPRSVKNGWIEIDRNFGGIDLPRPSISPDNDDFGPTLVEIRWRPDDVILYRCKSRFELAGGSKRRTCTSLGEWTGTQPKCIAKEKVKNTTNCVTPPTPTGGFVVPRGKLVWKTGDIYSVLCNPAYKPPSRNWAKCIRGGAWTPGLLNCTEIQIATCSSPVTAFGEALPSRESWRSGDTFSIKCISGFKAPSPNSATCQSDGSWMPASLTCTLPSAIYCQTPVVKHGRVLPMEVYSWRPGDVLSVVCSTGYREPSPNLSTCLKDGSWSVPELICEKIYCPHEAISDGWVLRDGSHLGEDYPSELLPRWLPGDFAYYRCRSDFRLVGDERRRCSEDGTWTGILPRCQVKPSVYCPPPPKIENGFIESDRNGGQNSQASSGQPGQSASLGTNHIVTRFVTGDVILYRCKNNFRLEKGSQRRVCHDGIWTGSPPRCLRKITGYCDSPPKVPNGFIGNDSSNQNSERWAAGDAIIYGCKDGFHLEKGSHRRVCTEEGTWTGSSPRCIVKSTGYCPSPPIIKNGYVVNDRNVGQAHSDMADFGEPVVTRWVTGDAIRYRCKSGYRLADGHVRRICTGEGTWTGKHPRCTRITVDDAKWIRLSNGLLYTATTRTGSFSESIANCRNVGGKIAGSSIVAGTILTELLGTSGIAIFGQSYWIGLTDRLDEQDWKWLNGTRMIPDELWHRFERDSILFGHQRDCAVITANPAVKWRAENCDGTHFAMCERDGDGGPSAIEHRSAVDAGVMRSAGSESEPFVVLPILIRPNSSGESIDASGDVESCDPNPCLNGCECEESGIYGYFCHALEEEQYLGENCEYDPPEIECEHDSIEISVSRDFIQGMDRGLGNGLAYLAPDEESASRLEAVDKGCRFSPFVDGVYRAVIPFPFDACGTYELSGDGGIAFANKIWYNRELSSDLGISVHTSVAEISCTYQDFYRVTSVINSVCCPTPPIISASGIFMFETTVWADPPMISATSTSHSKRNRTRVDLGDKGYISYHVGEMLYVMVKMKSRHGSTEYLIPSLRRCWISTNVDSHDPNTERDLMLLPRSDANVNIYGPVSTGDEVHFGFQLMRAKQSAIVYLHCHIKVVSRRTRRSLRNETDRRDSSTLTKGPIVFVYTQSRGPALGVVADGETDNKDSRTPLIVGVSLLGVAAIVLLLGCCASRHRLIVARRRQLHAQERSNRRRPVQSVCVSGILVAQ